MTQVQRPATTAAIGQASNASSGRMDNADVATLNDALGSAGVDLRVRLFSRFKAVDIDTRYTYRRKKKVYTGHMTPINPTVRSKIALGSNLQLRPSTLVS